MTVSPSVRALLPILPPSAASRSASGAFIATSRSSTASRARPHVPPRRARLRLALRPPRRGPPRPALVAFATAAGDDVAEIVVAVVVGDLVAGPDCLDGAQEHLLADAVGFRVRPAGMIG